MLQGKLAILGFDPARMAGAVVALACSTAVALTGAAGLHGGSAAGVPANVPAAVAFANDEDKACEDYVLSLDELEAAEKAWPEQRDDMLKRAKEWSPNAVLVQLNLNCDFFDNEGEPEETKDGIAWNGVFYNANGKDHLYWHSDSGDSYMVFEETAIDPEQIDFKQLAGWLDKADFDDDHRISALMVTNNPGSKKEPEDHFSYVLMYFDKDQKMFQVVVDSRDGTIVETAI
jgi:hypothetical protein